VQALQPFTPGNTLNRGRRPLHPADPLRDRSADTGSMGVCGHILVLDEEAAVRELVIAMLTREGIPARSAHTRDEVLEALADPALALVIGDLDMSELKGWELLEMAHERRPELPVVLTTAGGTGVVLSEALTHGAVALLRKPFPSRQLLDAIRDRCKPTRAVGTSIERGPGVSYI